MIGKTLAHYRIVEKLGEGGMGAVYLAEDSKLKRRVALKVLPRRAAGGAQQLERFQREAEAVAALNHPNIVTIHSVENATSQAGEPIHFLTMELVEGKTLDQVVPRGGLASKDLFDLGIQIAEALAAAHGNGITHRDLKPKNIMLTDDGRVKVLDFGLAKLAETDPSLLVTQAPTEAITQDGTVLGTYPYMSPEQVEGKALDPRTDIFSFGILLYEMATGVRPFHGETSAGLISSIMKDEPAPVDELKDELPHHLARIVSHCLEKEPDRRLQSALDVRNELVGLRREIESGEVSALKSTAQIAPRRVSTRRPLTVLVAGVGIVTVALLAFFARSFWQTPKVTTRSTSNSTVAVFPFQNLVPDAETDYLRLAIPDEVTTALSRATNLTVRPFATTRAYPTDGFDPLAAGRSVKAATVIVGQYFLQGEQLQLTLEAVDVERNQVLWRESIGGVLGDLIALRGSMAERVQNGLLPKLGARSVSGAGTVPSNEEAYSLYLRGLELSLDVEPNRRAIAMLEQAVELDPAYAPAWTGLARRYYYEGNYAQGGAKWYDSAVAAAKQALKLDPDLVRAAVRVITIQVERGELRGAWDEARRLLGKHPNNAEVHHAMAYALRYAGLVHESLAECELALALDPTNPRFRSCGISAYLAGAYERAEVFLRLDGQSQMFVDNLSMLRLRQGRLEEALTLFQSGPTEFWYRRYIVHCLDGGPPVDRREYADQIEPNMLVQLDGEQQYWASAYLSYCGEPERALRLLRVGVERGYCSFPAIDTDPLLENARNADGFDDLRTSAIDCQERFLAYRTENS